MPPRRRRRAESRARYFVRQEARFRYWNVAHVARGGDLLEENEIVDHFPDIGLGLERPDFLFSLRGQPVMVVETKNDASMMDEAINDAIAYADTINATGRYDIKIAVGVAGQEDTGYRVVVCFLAGRRWVPLRAYGAELTNIPAPSEVERALLAQDGTTTVAIPSPAEFIDAAIDLSSVLRACKVEAPLRPKVIGAMVLAMSQGEIDTAPDTALGSVNALVAAAVDEAEDLAPERKQEFVDALRLSGADFNRLSPSIGRVANILRRLNIGAVIETEADFLGTFYEAFLRYGYDNNALGIVFTPRHITQFCVELTGIAPADRVVDIACGTGGFLVSAFDKMMSQAGNSARTVAKIKRSLHGFDTNPTVWALAMLNMFFRGDGKSQIVRGSCFEPEARASVKEKFTRAYLNPPFSQEDEPERDFIDAALEALEPGGELAVVVKAGIFADDEHRGWRQELSRRHSPLAVISLPEELFYPTAAPTSILVARAHHPLQPTSRVMMARIWNDGYEKLKSKRVIREGSQLPEVAEAFTRVGRGLDPGTPLATVVEGHALMDGSELSPQQWLPQPAMTPDEVGRLESEALTSVIRAVAALPGLAETVLPRFASPWSGLPELPLNRTDTVEAFFHVTNGQSVGEKHYSEGSIAYVSSGDESNSIVRLVDADHDERFADGGISVTAFGQAALQPWPFVGRGNGGSSVRVLTPRYNMSARELMWFVAQINAQRWRFFYARMAIKSRLERLEVTSPATRLADYDFDIAERVESFISAFAAAAAR